MSMLDGVNVEFCVRLLLVLGHFVWQGALLGAVAWLASVVLKRRSAAARHNAFALVLAAMALSPVVTFGVLSMLPPTAIEPELSPASVTRLSTAPEISPPSVTPVLTTPEPSVTAAKVAPGTESASGGQLGQETQQSGGRLSSAAGLAEPLPSAVRPEPHAAESPSLPLAETSWRTWWAGTPWRAYAPHCAVAYLAAVTLLLLRLVVGLIGGARLKRRSRPVTESRLLTSLAQGATALGMRFAPALAFCEGVAVPTVVGIVRPMVLLPASLVSGLTPQQVECLLLHELAHIRRRDHLVNLFQRFVEAVLFYHPAVWFVSGRIRIEREHCCDDAVVALSVTARDYADALVTAAALCTGHRTLATDTALAAVGKPNALRVRVQRLLGMPGPSLRLGRGSWVAMLVLGAMAAGAFGVLASESTPEGAAQAPLAETPTPPPAPDAPPSAAVIEPPPVAAAPPEDAKPAAADKTSTGGAKADTTPQPACWTLLPDYRKLAPEVQELVVQLDDGNWWLRKLAIQQLSERNDPHVVPLAIAKLSDTDNRVKASAAEALGKAADPRAIKHLVAALELPEGVDAAAAEALTHFPAEKVLPMLRLALADKDMRLGALKALQRWQRPEVADMLMPLLSIIAPWDKLRWDGQVRNGLGHAVGEILSRQPQDMVADRLGKACVDPDPRVRTGAAALFCPSWVVPQGRSSAELPADVSIVSISGNPRVLDLLTVLSHDAECNVRAAAVDALAGQAIWRGDSQTAPSAALQDALVKRLRDEQWTIRMHAAAALEQTRRVPTAQEDLAWYHAACRSPDLAGPLGEVAVDPIVAALRAKKDGESLFQDYTFARTRRPYGREDDVRAVKALGETKSDKAIPMLADLVSEKDSLLSVVAATALETIGSTSAANALANALAGCSDGLRLQCLSGLAALGDPRGVAPLLAMAEAPNADTNTLREILGRYGHPEALGGSVSADCLIASLSSRESFCRRFALRVLTNSDDPRVAAAAIHMLESDESPGVLAEAANYVGGKKVQAAVPALEKVLLDRKIPLVDRCEQGNRDASLCLVRALRSIGGPDVTRVWMRAVSELLAISEAALCEAAVALGETKDPKAVGPLGRCLLDLANAGGNFSPTEAAVADAVGTVGGPEAARTLVDFALVYMSHAEGEYNEIRALEACIAALRRIAPPDSSDAFVALLQSSTGEAVWKKELLLCGALADQGDARAEPILKRLTSDPRARVAAEEVLTRLHEKTGKAPEPSPAASTPAPTPPPDAAGGPAK